MIQQNWSQELAFERSVIRGIAATPGVYRILQSRSYPRYRGCTRTLKIGMSRSGLRSEILNHFNRHAVANRLKRLQSQDGIEVTVEFLETTAEMAPLIEKDLLIAFEEEHFDLPLLNSARGHKRGADTTLNSKK